MVISSRRELCTRGTSSFWSYEHVDGGVSGVPVEDKYAHSVARDRSTYSDGNPGSHRCDRAMRTPTGSNLPKDRSL